MESHRTWDSEADPPDYEDHGPSLYRPSIWRRVLIIAAVLVPVLAGVLLIYSFIAPARVAVAPTSLASPEAGSDTPLAAALRERGLSRSLDLRASPPDVDPRGDAAQTRSKPGIPWPTTALRPPQGTPPAGSETGSVSPLAVVPLPRRRPRAADTQSLTERPGLPPEILSGQSYGSAN